MSEPLTSDSNLFKIPIQFNNYEKDIIQNDTITIQNDATLQRISFGSSILFDSDSTLFKKEGEKVLYEIASVFK